jgi:phage terminase large subunit-like protein
MLAMASTREILFGGAAGGAKSDALLMAALRYVDTPGYNAIIFRKAFTRLESTLIARSKAWLLPKGIKWNDKRHEFTFASGATLRFGFLDSPDDRWAYQGTEYHFMGFDELTEFALPDNDDNVYLFMNRSARNAPPGVPIQFCSTANPGNVGHEAVKRRFITKEAEAGIIRGENRIYQTPEGRVFIPSRIIDNPIVNEDEYRAGLSEMSPVTRERMMNGDWSITTEGVINPEWLRYYDLTGQIVNFYDATGSLVCSCDERECKRFATIDTAGTSEDVAKDRRGKPPSWSVMAIWDQLPRKFGLKIALRHVWRKRVGFTDLVDGIESTYRDWKPKRVRIEDKHFGPAVQNLLGGKMPISTVAAGQKDKLERATEFLNMLERGEVFLPRYDNDWRPTLEAEWLAWQGHPDETADQIDVASYAAWEAKQGGSSWGGPIVMSGGNRIGSF